MPIRSSRQMAWAMLPARLALFFGFQALFAAGFALAEMAFKWCPRLFPYFAILHVLIDLAAMAVYLIPKA